MELHSVHRKRAVPDSHDRSVAGARRRFEYIRQRVGDNERMVAAGDEGMRNAAEYATAVMFDRRHLAVHQLRRPDHRAAERDADALVAEAYAEHRDARAESANHFNRDSRVFGPPWTGGNHDALRLQRLHLVERDPIVPLDERRGPELTEPLREVIGERIVIVDEEQHQSPASAIASAVSTALALSRVSSYSAAGFESATMPAPAWTRARPLRMVMVRMAMQKSRLPAKSMYPTAPA